MSLCMAFGIKGPGIFYQQNFNQLYQSVQPEVTPNFYAVGTVCSTTYTKHISVNKSRCKKAAYKI